MSLVLLGLSGSPVAGSNCETFLGEALAAVRGPEVETRLFALADKSFEDCGHCNWCLIKQTPERPCRIDDALGELWPLVLRADALIVASPVYLGRLSGRLASALDRLRCLHYGRVHSGALKYKVGAALAVGWYRHSGLESTLLSLHLAFLTYQMLPALPGSQCTFGGAAVTSLGGVGLLDPPDKHLVWRDEFGLETGRATARAAVELARLIKKGQGT